MAIRPVNEQPGRGPLLKAFGRRLHRCQLDLQYSRGGFDGERLFGDEEESGQVGG